MAKKPAKRQNQIPKKVGRPSSYDTKYCNELIKHCSKGMSFESFAFKVGVSSRTLNNWSKHYVEFEEAHAQAKVARLYFY